MRTKTSPTTLGREANLSQTGPGLTLIDALLERLGRRHDVTAINTALDLRLLIAASPDGAAILRAFFRLRDAIDDQLYPLCRGLQSWLEAQVVSWVATGEFDPPVRVGLELDTANYDEMCACCKSAAVGGRVVPEGAELRFIYLPAVRSNSAAIDWAHAA